MGCVSSSADKYEDKPGTSGSNKSGAAGKGKGAVKAPSQPDFGLTPTHEVGPRRACQPAARSSMRSVRGSWRANGMACY
jgi:hypothetical protein